jgi:segregation and condensation protein B
MRLTQIVEALLFASDAPLSAGDIALIDERLDEDTVEAVVAQLREEYESQERAFTIFDIAGGYQLLTRPEFAPYLERFDTVPQQTRLSAPALDRSQRDRGDSRGRIEWRTEDAPGSQSHRRRRPQ